MSPIVVLAVLAWQQPAPVQEWSHAQQEIIEQVRRCNDAWAASHVEKRFEVFDAVCPGTSP